jgi:hypothetical protein
VGTVRISRDLLGTRELSQGVAGLGIALVHPKQTEFEDGIHHSQLVATNGIEVEVRHYATMRQAPVCASHDWVAPD